MCRGEIGLRVDLFKPRAEALQGFAMVKRLKQSYQVMSREDQGRDKGQNGGKSGGPEKQKDEGREKGKDAEERGGGAGGEGPRRETD